MENTQDKRPTQAAIAQRNQVIYEALAKLRDTAAADYAPLFVQEGNFDVRHLTRLQGILGTLETDYEALSYIYDEGPLEITVRSRGQQLTLAVAGDPGALIVEAMRSVIEDRLHDVANRIFFARESMAKPEEPEVTQRDQARQVEFREWLLAPAESLSLGGQPPASEQAA
jgi:hypothetical protein